MGMNEDKFGG